MQPSVTSPNQPQIDYWNSVVGERWARNQREVADMLGPFVAPLVAALDPQPGTHLIDIGCGSGDVSLVLADRIGAAGRVLGIDISKPMLEVATARTQHLGTITLIEADAATATLPDSPYDGALSRFGVMFFADPIAAFTHIRTQLRSGAPLVFCCWQAFERNPSHFVPHAAITDLLPEQPVTDPHAPGPYAFADDERVRSILCAAGFGSVDISPISKMLPFSQSGGIDGALALALRIGPAARAVAELDDTTRAQAMAQLRAVLSQHVIDGVVQLEGAVWLVRAIA